MNPYFVNGLAEQHRRDLLSARASHRSVGGGALRPRRCLGGLFTWLAERRHIGAPLATWHRRAALTTTA